MENHFIEKAVKLAVENARSGRGGPFAAIVVRSGELVARGTNRVVSANDPTAHAEINAIRKACRVLGRFQLSGCEIYVSCEPCPMCLGAIYWARLKRVYFAARSADAAAAGFDDELIYGEFRHPPGKRKIPLQMIRCDSALDPFLAWKNKRDRIPY